MWHFEPVRRSTKHRDTGSVWRQTRALRVCLRKQGLRLPRNKHQDEADIAGQEHIPEPEKRRVLLLSGRWSMPENDFKFTATLNLSSGGAAEGAIHWYARIVWGKHQNYSGIEKVRGQVTDTSAELAGYQADPLLSTDRYKLQLTGDAGSGTFRGISRTCVGDWSGRTWGTYMILERWHQ